ncbi:unnamed protein product [Amoebophrya sp. A120]|nr:unnamed protein product [Amoebophrya sp. A120]|eukprot:GSA120T00013850001.1
MGGGGKGGGGNGKSGGKSSGGGSYGKFQPSDRGGGKNDSHHNDHYDYDDYNTYHNRAHAKTVGEIKQMLEPVFDSKNDPDTTMTKFLSALEVSRTAKNDEVINKRTSLIPILEDHGGLENCARGWSEMLDLFSQQQGKMPQKEQPVYESEELWDVIQKIGFTVRDEQMRRVELELLQRLYKRGEYFAHYLYLSNFPDYNPTSLQDYQNKGKPGNDLPAVLMVAEKPSIAKIITEHLSGGRYRTKYGCLSRACQTYEFISYFLPHDSSKRQKCKIIVTSVIGHVFGLTFKKQKGLRPEMMFAAETSKEIEDGSRKMRVPEHLQDLAKDCEYLALWLDCDREGENICYEVISIIREHFPTDQNIYRAHFSAITEQEIRRSYDDLRRPNKFLAMSVDARQELDLKVGISFSTLLKYNFLDLAKQKFPRMDLKMLTYGPCQTPTLWFCVERHKEIKGFKREKWFLPKFKWQYSSSSSDDYGRSNNKGGGKGNKGGKGGNKNSRDEEEEVPENILVFTTEKLWRYPGQFEQFTSRGGNNSSSYGRSNNYGRNNYGSSSYGGSSSTTATILRTREEEKQMKKPVGLNTVQMLKAASALGLSPGTAMKVAEDLYSMGYISYPRTESTKYADSYNVLEVLEEQSRAPGWGKTVEVFLKKKNWNVPTPSHGHDAGDHPPITPCGPLARRDDMKKGNQWKLYEYVCRHFVASVMDDAYYTEFTVEAQIGNNSSDIFTSTFQTFHDKGFLFATPWKGDVFNDKTDMWRKMEKKGLFSAQGNLRIDVQDFKIVEGQTEPPQYLKESELIALMDKHGIGTDASMAGHIDNVVARNYCKVCGPCTDGNIKLRLFAFASLVMQNNFRSSMSSYKELFPSNSSLRFRQRRRPDLHERQRQGKNEAGRPPNVPAHGPHRSGFGDLRHVGAHCPRRSAAEGEELYGKAVRVDFRGHRVERTGGEREFGSV